jgi:hypothetical protein
MIVTHENFDEWMKEVEDGEAVFEVRTAYRIWRITKKTVLRFREMGMEAVRKSRSPKQKGFYIARGRNEDYVLPGYLFAEYAE